VQGHVLLAAQVPMGVPPYEREPQRRQRPVQHAVVAVLQALEGRLQRVIPMPEKETIVQAGGRKLMLSSLGNPWAPPGIPSRTTTASPHRCYRTCARPAGRPPWRFPDG
jgi:hypothetical protein